jgi:serine/threonine protein kinase
VPKSLKRTLTTSLNFRKSIRLERLSQNCKDFMLKMTSKDPLHRPSSKDALQSPWLLQGGACLQTACSEPNHVSSNACLTVNGLWGNAIDPIAVVEPERYGLCLAEDRVTEIMLADPHVSRKATLDVLSVASTAYCEADGTTGRERETFTSDVTTGRERETFTLREEETVDMLLDASQKVRKPESPPGNKCTIPYFLRQRRMLSTHGKFRTC